MKNKPTIVIIHPNSLCNFAIRTMLTDIVPFIGNAGSVEIAAYNTMQEFMKDHLLMVIHYFVAADIFIENRASFASHSKHCIVLVEDSNMEFAPDIHTIDVGHPENEMMKEFLSLLITAHTANGMQPHTQTDYAELLSPREKDVLALVVKGYINKEIADKLNISIPTVIFHRRNISEKLGSKSIGRMTIYAVMNGIVNLYEI